jgi:hypothetical protein
VEVAVIYYSATGNVYGLAQAVEEGAKEAGAEVSLRKVGELAPEEAIRSNLAWREHALETGVCRRPLWMIWSGRTPTPSARPPATAMSLRSSSSLWTQ